MGTYKSNFDAVVRATRDRAEEAVTEMAYVARDEIRQGLMTGERELSNDTMGAMASIYVVRASSVPGDRRVYGYAQARQAFLRWRLGKRGRATPVSKHRGQDWGRRGSYTREEVEKLLLAPYVPAESADIVRASVSSCAKDLAFWELGWRTRFRNRNGRSQSRMEKRPQFFPAAYVMRSKAPGIARAVLKRRRAK